LMACGSGGSDPRSLPTVPSEPDPGSSVTVRAQGLEAATELMNEQLEQTADDVRAAYPSAFDDSLGYDPASAAYLDEILEKALWSAQSEVRSLVELRGFAIARDRSYPSFAYGYSDIYMNDLPVYVSADMILEAVFRSHDKILQELERRSLKPLLSEILTELRTRLIEQPQDFSDEA